MGFEKHFNFNSICTRLRKRLGIKQDEDGGVEEDKGQKFDSVPDLTRKSWRRSKKSKKKKIQAEKQKEMGVSLARFDEELDRDLSPDSRPMYHSQPQFEWVSTQKGYIEESKREVSPPPTTWGQPKNTSTSMFNLMGTASPTPPPRRSKNGGAQVSTRDDGTQTVLQSEFAKLQPSNYLNRGGHEGRLLYSTREGVGRSITEDLNLKIREYERSQTVYDPELSLEGLLKIRDGNVIDMKQWEEKRTQRYEGPTMVESRKSYTKETYHGIGSPSSLHDFHPRHFELSPKISGKSYSTLDSDDTLRSSKYKIYDIPFETTHFPIKETAPTSGMEIQITKGPRRDSDASRELYGSSHLKIGDESTLGSRPESGLEISLPRSDYTGPWTPTGSPALSSRQSSQKTWMASPRSVRSHHLASPRSMEILTPTREIVDVETKSYVPRYEPRYSRMPKEDRKQKAISTLTSPKSLEALTKTLDKLDTSEREKQRSLAKSELHLKKISRTESVQSAIDFLKHRVRETKYVTAIFESKGGIGVVIDDVIKEFTLWLGEFSHLLGVAVEVHWSVPENHRSRANEIKLKDALHRVLRNNNRRVLDLYEECRNILPQTFYESKTEENCNRDTTLNAFQVAEKKMETNYNRRHDFPDSRDRNSPDRRNHFNRRPADPPIRNEIHEIKRRLTMIEAGIYRRFYPELLALQDQKTINHHRSYWELKNLDTADRNPPKPDPASFLYKKNPDQLKNGSIVAVNLATIRLEKDDDKENRKEDFIQQILDTNEVAVKASKSPVNVKYVLNIQKHA